MIVFKYLHEERIDVLESLLIRFTQPGCFNDPYEALPSIESILPKGQASSIFDSLIDLIPEEEISALYQEEIQKIIASNEFTEEQLFQLKNITLEQALITGKQILKPSLDRAFDLEDEEFRKSIPYKFRDGIDKSIGILSVSEINNNVLMWSHYANSHKGFVILFDSNHEFFDQRKTTTDQARVLQKVIYKDQRPKITLYDPSLSEDEFIDLFVKTVILTKHERWSYESEWRMAHMLGAAEKTINNGEEVIYLFQFPREIIKGIIFGSRMKENLKKEILQIVRGKGFMDSIQFFQADMDMENYEVNIHEYKAG